MVHIYSRFKDIISSNLNAMLDRAEDPEKMIKLMITEMEDTLAEIRASCAGAMASQKRVERALEECRDRGAGWEEKAELAINKGREDLAREALYEKRRCLERANVLEEEALQTQGIVDQYKEEITQLESKVDAAKEKQRLLLHRHIHAQGKKRAREELRRIDTSDAWLRFEQFENRIERMEAEADLAYYGRGRSVLDNEFDALKGDEELEKELEELKAKTKSST
jgi:phage shock protein A